jgi:hypothetical protein
MHFFFLKHTDGVEFKVESAYSYMAAQQLTTTPTLQQKIPSLISDGEP